METLLHASIELLASGKPLRTLLPDLFDRLVSAFGAGEATLALRTADGYRVACHVPDGQTPQWEDVEPSPTAIAIPMQFAGTTIGGVVVRRPGRAFVEAERLAIETWAAMLSLSLHQIAVEEENKRLEAIAENDQLTGIANRRALDAHLRTFWQRTRDAGEAFSLVVFDIDYFKSYNDRYGHVAGDAALRRVALALAGCLHRPSDLLARFGGEEFVAALPGTDASEAIALAERMRSTIFDLRVPHEDSGLGVLTVSAGVACSSALDADSGELLARADDALYRAKHAGRNHVAATGYLSISVPAAHPAAGIHNMPSARSAFIGRETELAYLQRMLERTRIATIAGPGGAGKTRLAVQASRWAAERFRDVWYVDVSSARDESAIFDQIASMMGVQQAGTSIAAAVCERLHASHLLLVFDGCERALDAARAATDRLIAGTARLCLLAVSRETLNLPGESVLRLLGLQPAEARALFGELVAAPARPQALQDDALVESICRQVDYLPLGIELFASQLSAMSLAQLELLVAQRMVPLRTLEDVIGWSVSMLADRQRERFVALAAFESGWTEASAYAVAGAEPADLALFESKSLVVRHESAGATRYTMLDTLQEFSRRAIDERTWAALRERHYRYYRELAGRGDHDRLDAERPNLGAALEYALAQRQRSDVLGFANALARFWIRRGYLNDGMHWFLLGLDRDGSGDEAVVANANRHVGMIARKLGDFDVARAYNERALSIWRSLDNVEGTASALNGLALVAHTVGDFDRARTLYEESLKQYERLDDRLGAAMAINNLGGLAVFQGDFEIADARISEAIVRARALEDRSLDALATSNLAELRFLQGRFGDTVELAQSSLQARLSIGDRPGLAATWLLLANAHMSLGEIAQAWQPARETLLLYHEIGDRHGLAVALLTVARLAREESRDDDAARLVKRSDAMVERTGAPLFGAERAIRDLLAGVGQAPSISAPADFEAAFEDALATFR